MDRTASKRAKLISISDSKVSLLSLFCPSDPTSTKEVFYHGKPNLRVISFLIKKHKIIYSPAFFSELDGALEVVFSELLVNLLFSVLPCTLRSSEDFLLKSLDWPLPFLESSLLSLERSFPSRERSSPSLDRFLTSLERSNLSLERSNLSLERSNLSLERSLPSLERFISSFERSRPSLELSNFSLDRSRPSLERSPSTLERSRPSPEWSLLPLERSLLSLEVSLPDCLPSCLSLFSLDSFPRSFLSSDICLGSTLSSFSFFRESSRSLDSLFFLSSFLDLFRSPSLDLLFLSSCSSESSRSLLDRLPNIMIISS